MEGATAIKPMDYHLGDKLVEKSKTEFVFYVYKCSICMYACMTEEGIGSHYRWLLGIELRTSGRTASTLNH